VEYLMSDPSVAGKQATSALFILSDMEDNWPEPRETAKRAVAALTAYGKCGGSVGMYYVDPDYVSWWRRQLQGCGLRSWWVESGIVGKPTLPDFD
jgi:hypothetical protein